MGKNRPTALIFVVIIANACLWAFAIVMSAYKLRGTGGYQEIQTILGGSAAASLIAVGGGLAAMARRLRQDDQVPPGP
jgi:hypothetical protein